MRSAFWCQIFLFAIYLIAANQRRAVQKNTHYLFIINRDRKWSNGNYGNLLIRYIELRIIFNMEDRKSSFCKTYVYIVMDVFFVIFGVLYVVGDSDHLNIKAFSFFKPLPVWIMIAELFTVRNTQKNIKGLMVALAFGSLGDILLELQSYGFALFAAGALSFLVGHLIYVACFAQMAQEIAEGRVEMKEILRLKYIYILIWILFFVFSFWSIGTIMRYLDSGSILMLIVPIYGTFLCMLAIAGTFVFFMTFKIKQALKTGILCMSGAVIFYSSDSFLAHGKFDTAYTATVSSATNDVVLMVTYYVAQYLLGKAGLAMAEYMENETSQPACSHEVTPEVSDHIVHSQM